MSDAEINKAVAKAAGYEIRTSSGGFCFHVMDGEKHLGGISPRGKYDSGFSTHYDPLHDANQAIEALDRVFGQEWVVTRSEKDYWICSNPYDGEAFSGTGPTFCAAACNAILGVKEKRDVE